jgi:ectoine hydroxylase-related dioxygenase (phytanoyl-CoA dioxygenase family)
MAHAYGWMVPSEGELSDPAALRERAGNDGYLWLRGLLPASDVAALRAEILAVCATHGWLRAGGADNTVEPAAACQAPDDAYYGVYREVMKLQRFNELAHHQAILEVMALLLDTPTVLVRPAKLARLVFPQDDVGPTPPHQDFPHEQGTANAYTCWVPLGGCPRELGGLAVWPGSHRAGVHRHGFVPGVGGLGIPLDDASVDWLTADFVAGDVVLFHSLTVHKATRNATPDRLRISADYRYQRVDEPVPRHALSPSGGSLGWDEIYAGWSEPGLRYYWRQWDLHTVEYDYSYYDARDDEVLAQAHGGNADTRNMLHAIIKRGRSPEKVTAARVALAALDAGRATAADG